MEPSESRIAAPVPICHAFVAQASSGCRIGTPASSDAPMFGSIEPFVGTAVEPSASRMDALVPFGHAMLPEVEPSAGRICSHVSSDDLLSSSFGKRILPPRDPYPPTEAPSPVDGPWTASVPPTCHASVVSPDRSVASDASATAARGRVQSLIFGAGPPPPPTPKPKPAAKATDTGLGRRYGNPRVAKAKVGPRPDLSQSSIRNFCSGSGSDR